MRGTERHGWIYRTLLSGVASVLAAILAGAFLPVSQCPSCEEVRMDFAALGIDLTSAKSMDSCPLCGAWGKKVSWFKVWKYRRAHPVNGLVAPHAILDP